MSVATFRSEVTAKLRDFAWGQWSQMGLSGAPPSSPERRAADPEALLLFSLEVGRHDPRLFDEVLDWLVLNESLISVQRLRNLCVDEFDRALVAGAIGWVSRWQPRARFASKAQSLGSPQPLFVGLSLPEGPPEPSFAGVGLLRPDFAPSRKSQPPDFTAPINIAFRLRRLLGIGARAEVSRVLLTSDAAGVTTGVLGASAGFTRPNVREALAQLRDAGVAHSRGRGSDALYAVRREDWARLLQIRDMEIPRHQDWIQTLGPLRLVLRWLSDDHTESLSDYMRASEARALMGELEPDLRFAGFAVGGSIGGRCRLLGRVRADDRGRARIALTSDQPQKTPVRSCSGVRSVTSWAYTIRGSIRLMARKVQARLDRLAEEDLAVLRREGYSDSDAVRLALHEAAERRRRRSTLRLEAERAAADEEDRADARLVRSEMHVIAAPWPED